MYKTKTQRDRIKKNRINSNFLFTIYILSIFNLNYLYYVKFNEDSKLYDHF